MGKLISALRKNMVAVIIITATVILAIIAIYTALRLYQLRNQPTSEPKAWDCSRYTFNLEASGIVTVENTSHRSEPAQQAKVYVNGNQVATLNVPAMSQGQDKQLGIVDVPTEGVFNWEVQGTSDCGNSGQHQLTQTSCTTFTFTLSTPTPSATPTSSPSPSPSPTPTPSPTATPVPGEPAIDIEKHTNGYDADDPKGPELVEGDDVKWEYIVTNIGDKVLSNVEVVDDKEGVITCPKDTLAVDEQMVCTLHSTAKVYQYSNSATVTGYDASNTKVTDTDTSHYWGEGKPYSPTPTATSTPSGTTTPVASAPTSSTEPLPQAGVSTPTLIGISSAALLLLGALLLAM